MKKRSNARITICMLLILGVVMMITIKNFQIVLAVMVASVICAACLLKSSRTYVDRKCSRGKTEDAEDKK